MKKRCPLFLAIALALSLTPIAAAAALFDQDLDFRQSLIQWPTLNNCTAQQPPLKIGIPQL